MIQKLEIENFQAHQNSVLEFSPNLNVVSGNNDVGKTSIIRALNWIINNRPLGEGVVRKNQKDSAFVSLTMDKVTVSKERGKNINTYTLCVEGKEPQIFTAFGSSPPEFITEALNFSEINIQTQHELPFLVLDSPGQVALCIREATKIDIIDNVISKIGSKIRNNSSVLETKKEELATVEKELEVLSQVNLERFEKLLLLFKELQTKREEIASQKTFLENAINTLEKIDKSIFVSPKELEDKILLFEQLQKEFEQQESQLSSLESIISSLEKIDKVLLSCPKDIEEKISLYEEEEKQYNMLCEEIKDLSCILKQDKEISNSLAKLEKEEKSLEERKLSLYQELKQCPLCEQKLDEEAKSRILHAKD